MASAPQKQFYPAFLKQFRGQAFDAKALEAAYYNARIGGEVRGAEEKAEFFRTFSIDESHWHLHQRILHDDMLFRLIAEGYIHPKVHPVAAIYHDPEFYPFVFPFIYTAILRKLAEAISKENLEAVKLLEQWIEPFGTLFRDAFYRMIEYTAEQLLRELETLKLNRKNLPFDTYGRISPALMHLLNRLPDRQQALRDRFATEIIQFAVWLRNDMKVYTQPSGLLTRLKLLNLSADIHAQRTIQMKQWESEKDAAEKEKFSLNHLIWIIPLVLLMAFFVWRQTDMGKSSEAILEEQEEQLAVEQALLEEKMEKIRLRMENIDLNQLIAEELYVADSVYRLSGTPVAATADAGRLDNSEMLYLNWLSPGREVYPVQYVSLCISNQSSCDAVVFLRQTREPYMERAYYVRAGRILSVYDNSNKRYYTMRIYAGTGWRSDSLVSTNYDQKLLNAGVPEEVKEEFPATTDLRGRFLYPVKSLSENLQPIDTKTTSSYMDMDGNNVIELVGDHNGITIAEQR